MRPAIAMRLLRLAKELVSADVSEQDVAKFLFENPNPSDKAVHDWAEGQGLNVHKVEEHIYRLATKFAHILNGGLAAKKGFKKEDADPKELAMGVKVEMEHTSDKDVAEVIALSHLAELKNYYSRLKKMEGE